MAGKIKKLSRADGVTTTAPTGLAFDGKLSPGTVGGDTNDGTDGYVLFEDQSADPTATTGDDVKVFCKDKGLYKVDSTGVATEIGSGTGSGELNYVTNPSGAVDETGWDASTAGEVDVSRTVLASELPRENLTASGIKIAGTGTVDATNDYVVFGSDPLNPWILDDADLGKLLKITWDQKPLGTYAAGDYECVVYDVDKDAEIECSVSAIPAYTGQFYTTFMTDSTSTNYQLWIRSTVAETDGIVISDVVVGPGLRVMSPDNRWPSYDETEVTITGSATLSSYTARLVPYQDTEGNWRLTFNVAVVVSSTARTSYAMTIDGVSTTITQSISGFYDGTSTTLLQYFNAASDNFIIAHASQIATSYNYSGDVSIDSKPTWATKPSPDMYIAGMPDTEVLGSDWTSFTPTNTQGFGTISGVNLEWRSNGPDLELRGYFTSGTVTASELQLELPNSYVIGGSGTGVVYAGTLMEDRTSSSYGNVLATKGDTYLNFSKVRVDASGAVSPLVPDGPLFASSTRMSIIAKVPIQGWTTREYLANAIVGFNEATETRPGLVKNNVVAMTAYRTTNQNIGTAATTLIFDTASPNTGTAYNTTNGEYTVPMDGIYSISFSVYAQTLASTTSILVGIYKNGTLITSEYITDIVGSKYYALGRSIVQSLSADDVITIAGGSAGQAFTAIGSFQNTYLSIHKIGDNE